MPDPGAIVKTRLDSDEAMSDGRRRPTKADGDGQFELVSLDWERLQREGLPKIEYLDEPYIPARARIWASGPTEAAKSIWAMWKGAQLSHQGRRVSFVSMENPLAEDARRLDKLGPDWGYFTFYHHEQQPEVFDLVKPEHVEALIRVATGQDLVILDTFTGCWAGDENSNEQFNVFDRDVMRRVVNETGSSIFVADHTGHAQPFIRREGAEAARGASSKGQKADSFLQFKPKGDRACEITHGKARMGGTKAPPAKLKVIDTPEGGLDIVPASPGEDPAVSETADELVAAIEAAGWLTTKTLKAAVPRRGQTVVEAMALLRSEDPPRVQVREKETVPLERKDGTVRNQPATVWRLAGSSLFTSEEPGPKSRGGDEEAPREETPKATPGQRRRGRRPTAKADETNAEAGAPVGDPPESRPPDPTPSVASEEPRPSMPAGARSVIDDERGKGYGDDVIAETVQQVYSLHVDTNGQPEEYMVPGGYSRWTGPVLRWLEGRGPKP